MSRRKLASSPPRTPSAAGGPTPVTRSSTTPARATAGLAPTWPSRAMEFVWLGVAAVMPIVVNPASVRVFEAEKVAILRSAALMLVVLWIAEWLAGREGRSEKREESGEEQPAKGDHDLFTSRFSLVAQLARTPLALPVLAIVAAYVAAALLSDLPRVSILGSYRRQFGALTYLAYGVIFFAVATRLRTPAQARRLLVAIAAGTLLPCLVSLVQLLMRGGVGWLPWPMDPAQRVVGTLGQPTFLGGYLAMAIPASIYLLVHGRSWRGRILPGSLILLQAGILVLSESRGAWAGAAVGIATLGLAAASAGAQHRFLHSRWLRIGLSAALLVVVAANVKGTGIHEVAGRVSYLGRLATLTEFDTGTGRVRALIWEQIPGLVAERPILGHGPEMMAYSFERYYPSELGYLESRSAVVDRAHNWLLEALVSTGVLGAAAQLALLWALVAAYRRARRTRGRGDGETGRRGDGETGGHGEREPVHNSVPGTQNSGPSTQHPALDVLDVAVAGISAGLVDQMVGIPSAVPTLLLWLYLGLASASAGGAGSWIANGAKRRERRPNQQVSRVSPGSRFSRSKFLSLSRPEFWRALGPEWSPGRYPVVPILAAVTAAAVLWVAVLPVRADVVAARGAALLEAGRWQDAFDAYREAAGAISEAEYYLQMGQVATEALQHTLQQDVRMWTRRGAEALARAQQEDPQMWDVAMAQGKFHQTVADRSGGARREREAAVASYQRAVLLAPRRPAPRDAYASALMDLEHYGDALGELQESLRAEPGYAPTFGYLGECYSALGRQAEALDAFRRGVELDPNSPALRNGLARSYVRNGAPASAAKEYEEALTLAPGNANLYLELANLHLAMSDFVKARQALAKGLAALPGQPDLVSALSRLQRP